MTSVNQVVGTGGTIERSRHAPLDSYLVSRRLHKAAYIARRAANG